SRSGSGVTSVTIRLIDSSSSTVSFNDDKIEPSLRETITNSPNQQRDLIVRLTAQVNDAELNKAYDIEDWEERGQYVYDTLKTVADNSQADLLEYLEIQHQAGKIGSYEAFFITNAVYVKDASLDVLDALSMRTDIKFINANKAFSLPRPNGNTNLRKRILKNNGIAQIKAEQVWDIFSIEGQGIVVANIDTGVDYEHPALKGQYRGYDSGSFDHNYNWYDPKYGSIVPNDLFGHGTKTMGVMVGNHNDGTNDIYTGVAPKAKWIATQIWEFDIETIQGAQWLLAPKDLNGNNPQASKRPHVANLSFMLCPSTLDNVNAFHAIVKAWRAAWIFPIFGAGNSNALGCPTSINDMPPPGNFQEGLTAGAIDSSNNIPNWSYSGNFASTGIVKPDVVAPGGGVIETTQTGGGYVLVEGTSISAPHLAGCVALMRSADPSLSFEEVKNILTDTADNTVGSNDPLTGDTSFLPNVDNDSGYGLINCFEAVLKVSNNAAAKLQCPQEPTLISSGFDGEWENDSFYWKNPDFSLAGREPKENDVVLIVDGVTVTLKGDTGIKNPEIKIKALCNHGTLKGEDGDESLTIEAPEGIFNYFTGEIKGVKGVSTSTCGSGQTIKLQAAENMLAPYPKIPGYDDLWYSVNGDPGPIYNEGLIQAGDGGTGTFCSGDGGDVIVLGHDVQNLKEFDVSSNLIKDGKILGGHGGTTTHSTTSGNGGNGGLAQVFGKLGGTTGNDDGGILISTGSVVAGNGGKGQNGGTNGTGGNLWLVAYPNVYLGPDADYTGACMNTSSCDTVSLDREGHKAGMGGNGVSSLDGWVRVEPSVISINSGAIPEIQGGDITIFGGDDFILELNNLTNPDGTVVEATGDVILAVGKNGVVDLTGSTGTVLKAAGEVKIYADEIKTDAGKQISDIIQADKITVEPSKILRDVLLSGATQVTGQPNTTIPVSLTVANGGPVTDTFNFSISDTAGWQLGQMLPYLEVAELSTLGIGLDVILPSTNGATNTITITATSQADPTVVSTAEITVKVALPADAGEYSTSGNVLNGQNQPIEKVTVQIADKIATTDETGHWSIVGITEGEYTVNASKEGYTFEPAQVNLTGDETALQVTLVMLSEQVSYRAFGILKDKEGNPLPGVTIKIGDKTTTTDATGSWEINGLAEGEYTVITSKAGYQFDSKPCVVSNNVKVCQPALKLEPVLDVKVVPEPRIAKQGENVTYSITV
ncbi:MAG: S8 family serine peptidase, partial [Candidatus Parabeggiatoa sp.]|nr:S8 family serine peptidase [Candidatus Parabeggiatoa sp.]